MTGSATGAGAAAVLVILWGMAASADQPRPPRQWLDHFSQHWSEQDWTVPSRTYPAGYLRKPDERGWQARMLALQGVVSHGPQAVPVLVEALRTGDAPQRIFAGQALGYLAPHAPRGPLLRAAADDEDPAVRLYAVDALAMQGDAAEHVDWDRLLKAERNGDVRKHIGHAVGRGNVPLQQEVVETLKDWDPARMDSATIGSPAPDFTLESVTGERVRLSGFRGKKAVVLVFIYGDT